MTPLPRPSTEEELNEFLKSVERRAFKRTVYAVRDPDAALDIIQDSMIRLCNSYADRPSSEWPMLFQRILFDGHRGAPVVVGLARRFSLAWGRSRPERCDG